MDPGLFFSLSFPFFPLPRARPFPHLVGTSCCIKFSVRSAGGQICALMYTIVHYIVYTTLLDRRKGWPAWRSAVPCQGDKDLTAKLAERRLRCDPVIP